MQGLRVLFVTHNSYLGGSNHSLLQLIIELRANYGVEPLVLVRYDKIPPLTIQDKFKENNITYINAKYYWYKERKGILRYIRYFLNWTIYYPKVFYKLRKIKLDLVHSNVSVIDIGLWISKIKHTKHIWHLREFGDSDFGIYPVLGRFVERCIYKRSDQFIAISQAIKNAYKNVIPENKISLIYNGVVIKAPNLMAKHTSGIVKFVLVGAICETKNQMEALRAFKLLIDRGYNAQLHFVGLQDEKYFALLKKYITEHSLDKSVKFWGVRDDVAEILSEMDVGLMLSRSEAFGRVTVEYMLQNLAVIASNTGANPELIDNGKTGYIYELGDIEKLAAEMQFYIENKDIMLQIANNGRVDAINRFSSIQNTIAVYNLYSKVINQ